ncbi:MAG: DNA polymerase III subunit beta [Gammaproteobacteria bacterium]|nr:MAG: DNA polymerase III subunit beta [Gammaproteobacteria bacterium]RKZ95021.1 MAG: DNA polymerase III subunit beta [Gammaproteobacteria bacterium]RKZ98139.1 MAG: DNA polymerase III subunit beta [Gammaproteobacteria bacterium]RKZ99778.1 MAG: DNA polymerase III subunit beta [Gammaproteobacteria bacterium]
MQFTVSQEVIVRPLQLVCSIVERRATLPILSTILLRTHGNQLTMTSTDMELEMIATLPVAVEQEGKTTVSARKFLDICRALPSNATISFKAKDNKAVVRAGKSRFSLSTLSSEDFPDSEGANYVDEIRLPQSALKALLDETSFAMASQDVRYYLNGLLLEREDNILRAVATDGHRLALGTLTTDTSVSEKNSIIVPRKAILELGRLLGDSDDNVTIAFSNQQIKVELPDLHFTSKLIDGQFPNYERVLPLGGDKEVIADRDQLKQALSRAAILSSDKHRSVRINLEPSLIKATVINQEQESAEEEISVDYQGSSLEIAFNNAYLLDLLNAIPDEKVKMVFSDDNSSVLISPANEKFERQYVVMPMRL